MLSLSIKKGQMIKKFYSRNSEETKEMYKKQDKRIKMKVETIRQKYINSISDKLIQLGLCIHGMWSDILCSSE